MRRGVRLKYVVWKKAKGRRYCYFEREGFERLKLPSHLPENNPEFLRAYAEAMATARTLASARAPAEGTVGALIVSYRASRAWAQLADSTRRQRAPVLDAIRAKAGDAPLGGLREKHIRKDLRGMPDNPANLRLKVWRALMAHALDVEMIDADPSAGVKRRTITTAGHHAWSRDEIAAFRAAHAYGTKARLVFELAFWTGARREDLTRLGWQMVGPDGWLTYRQGKTGGEVDVPFTCELPAGCAALAEDQAHLLAALDAAPRALLFVTTERGAGRSPKAFGAWFKKHAQAAGLPDVCALHGLRKARSAALGELGWSAGKIGAWTGHKSLSEVDRYTKSASRRRMLEGTEQERNSRKPIPLFSENGGKS